MRVGQKLKLGEKRLAKKWERARFATHHSRYFKLDTSQSSYSLSCRGSQKGSLSLQNDSSVILACNTTQTSVFEPVEHLV